VKKVVLSLFSLSVLLISTIAQAQAGLLGSFPSHWQGTAGDLVVRVPAVFTIVSSTLTSRDAKQQSEDYSVDGSFQFGTRTVRVSKITLRNYASGSADFETAEFVIYTDDDLVPNIFVIVVHDKKMGSFKMNDLVNPPQGKRFVLVGQP
jgi:hypothetical protein